MNTTHLNGATILVTRPKKQAEPLCNMINAYGGVAISQPTMEIIPTLDDPSIKNLLNNIDKVNLFIFVSQNAVIYGLPLIQSQLNKSQEFATIGNASARLLTQHGIDKVIYPQDIFNTETLLDLERLQNVNKQTIAIISGINPRPKLAKELIERGANVISTYVYRSELPQCDMLSTLVSHPIDGIVCTSLACLENFLNLCGAAGLDLIRHKRFIVITPMMEIFAKNLGINNIYCAKNANEESLMEAIIASGIGKEKRHD
ncbi:MAG: uroporphyrinogen-III synthase [Legionellales bacterium]|nr:uroporphyrinogen-III synthase [Legionellales bacterium]